MKSQVEALAVFTHYIEYYGDHVGSMDILGKLISDVTILVEKGILCISDAYFGNNKSFG